MKSDLQELRNSYSSLVEGNDDYISRCLKIKANNCTGQNSNSSYGPIIMMEGMVDTYFKN